MHEPAPEATRILIVDDDASVRDVIGVLLTEEGYDCLSAPGAEKALDAARESEFHLVISDVKMPGKDGVWLLDRLRKEHPDTAVVMLSAFGDTEAAVECLRRGCRRGPPGPRRGPSRVPAREAACRVGWAWRVR